MKSKILILLLLIVSFSFANEKCAVKKSDTPILKSNKKNSKIIKKAKFGEMLEIISEKGDWYKVKSDKGLGYVKKINVMKFNTVKKKSVAPVSKKQYTQAPKNKPVTNHVKDASWLKKNRELRTYEIKKSKHVKKMLKEAKKGYDGAIVAIEKGLINKKADVRKASFDALVTLGPVVIPVIGPKIYSSRIYMEKKQIVMIFKHIKNPLAVKYLQRGLVDKSIESNVIEAFKVIPGEESRLAIQRIEQSQLMKTKIDSIKRVNEEKHKKEFADLSLEYKDLKSNIVTLAWEMSQYKKQPPKTAPEKSRYNSIKKLFNSFVTEYDMTLGKGAALKMLEGNGYTKESLIF